MEKKSLKFIRSALALGLEQGIDDVVLLNSLPTSAQPSLKSIWWQVLTTWPNKSTLSWWQKWRLFCYIWSLPKNKVEIKNIDSLASWQHWQKNQPQPVNPTCSLSIINNTDKAKLAAKLGQALENSGVRVVRTTTEGNQQIQTEIFASPATQDCEFSLSQAEQLLPFSEVKTQIDNSIATKYRADVVILIGNDLGNLVDPDATLQ